MCISNINNSWYLLVFSCPSRTAGFYLGKIHLTFTFSFCFVESVLNHIRKKTIVDGVLIISLFLVTRETSWLFLDLSLSFFRLSHQLRRTSETASISPPGSSPLLGSPHRFICVSNRSHHGYASVAFVMTSAVTVTAVNQLWMTETEEQTLWKVILCLSWLDRLEHIWGSCSSLKSIIKIFIATENRVHIDEQRFSGENKNN